jgi:hypothetical protein
MNRRDFLRTAGAFGCGQVLGTGALAAQTAASRGTEPFTLALMNTFIDWYFGWSPQNAGKEPLPWGPDAVKRILDRHAAAGNKTLYWRTTDGGDAMYWSKLCRVSHGPTTDEARRAYGPELTRKFEAFDFKKFDVFRTAIDYAHQLGMRVLAWFEFDNEDHGLGPSEFALRHPKMRKVWRDRTVAPASLSWAFPEVVEYKVAMAKEMLDYGCDGLFLDLLRGNGGRPMDAEGVALWDYAEPVTAAYRARTGRDAFAVGNGERDWIDLRAGYVTAMLRAVRTMMKRHHARKELVVYANGKNSPVQVMKKPPNMECGPLTDPYQGMFVDAATWAKEGLVDAFCASRWPGPPWHIPTPDDIRLQVNHFRPLLGDHCRLFVEIYGFNGTGEQFITAVRTARDLGCDGAVVSEDGSFELSRTWDSLGKANELFGRK